MGKTGRNLLSTAGTALLAAALLLPLWAFLSPMLGGVQGPPSTLPQTPGAPPGTFDPAYWKALLTSMQVAAGAALLAGAFGLAVAFGLLSAGCRLGSFWVAACLLPLTMPPSVAVSGWIALASESAALTMSAFAARSPGTGAPGFIFSPFGVSLVLATLLWPLVTLHALPALRSAVASEAFAAARLSGPPARAFFHIGARLAAPEIATGVIAAFLIAMADFSVGSLLLVRVFPVEIFEALSGRYDLGEAARSSSILFLLTAAIGIVLHARTSSRTPWEAAAGDAEESGRSASAARRGAGLAAVALVFILTYALPMLVLALRCGGPARAAESIRAAMEPIGVSMRLAAGTAALTTGLAAIVACVYAGRVPPSVSTAAMLLMAVPGAAVGSGVLRLFCASSSPLAGLLAGFPLLAAGMCFRWMYVPLRLADLGARSLHPDSLDAAGLAGYSPRAAFAGVGLPRLAGHLAVGFAVVFSLTVGDTAVSSVLFPPGETPLSVRLFEFQHYGYTEGVFALALGSGILAALPVLAGAAFLGRWRRPGKTRDVR